MRAIIYTRYGAPEVLTLTERDKPVPRFDQVLVKVHAVSLNPLEWHHVRGKPFLVRISAGLAKPKPEYQVQGTDVAGIVDAVGADVTRLKVGDTVFGNAPFRCLADFVAVKEPQLSIMPVGFSMIEATCLPVAGGTALQALQEYGKVQTGDQVLINGSSGGVGIFSVQIAKALGARVTAVCSTRNIELARSLGADEVLDYTGGDVIRAGKLYDVVLDNVGNYSLQTFKRLLKPVGRGVVVGFTSIGRILHTALFGKMRGRSIALMFSDVPPKSRLCL